MKTEKEFSNPDEIIDLGEIFSIFWKEKFTIIVISIFFGFFSIFYSLSLPDIYKSESILSVQKPSNNNNSLSGYSGIASLVGVNIYSSGENKSKLAIQILTSREFFKHLYNYDFVLPSIMAVAEYDKETSSLVYDSNLYKIEEKKWKDDNGNWTEVGPSYLEAYEEYIELLGVKEDPVTGFITLSIDHPSPEFSKKFLEMIIYEVNDQLRKKDLKESDLALKFLKGEAATASLLEIKRSISNLIEDQLEIQMMAKINDQYVLKIIEPPFMPEKKFQPNRARICILITLLGIFFGSVIALLKFSYKKPN